MKSKGTRRKNIGKLVIRIVCLVLAISMVAATFFMLLSYMIS